jgi:hypothetical protein
LYTIASGQEEFQNMEDVNKTTPQDIAYATVKAAVGSVPIVGSAASEILGLIVAPPLEKRRNKLMTEIGQRLKDLEDVKRINLNDLSENQQFIDTVLQATTMALKTNDIEKIKAFKNAIINTALNETPNETLTQIFLNLIDNFTSWHIRILYLFNDPQDWFKVNNKSLPNFMAAPLSVVVMEAYPELKGRSELLNIIWGDLKRAGLHDTGELGATMSGGLLLTPRTTEIGRQFLKYIHETN